MWASSWQARAVTSHMWISWGRWLMGRCNWTTWASVTVIRHENLKSMNFIFIFRLWFGYSYVKFPRTQSNLTLRIRTQVGQGGTWMGSKRQLRELRHLDVVGLEDKQPVPSVRWTYFLSCHPWNYNQKIKCQSWYIFFTVTSMINIASYVFKNDRFPYL